ncbi:unnamed protein product, partial [Mesorhabditis belari]|uniref:Uncharacterized protein n=1 Tax=Mesorhabditis belari TaxID=2138241 RepID=A0AAF3F7Q4_9BILA
MDSSLIDDQSIRKQVAVLPADYVNAYREQQASSENNYYMRTAKILELKGDFSFVDQKEVKESDDEKLDRMIDQSALDLAQRTNMLNEDNRTEQCQQQAPSFLLSTLICKPLDALDICEDDKRKEQGYDVCNSVLGKNSPQGFEQESIDMRNIAKQIAEEMETKIRVISVEAPRVASALHIKTLEAKIHHLMRLAKEVVKSL